MLVNYSKYNKEGIVIMKVKINNKKNLFDPNSTFTGNTDTILKGYPQRSRELEKYASKDINPKNLNPKFIKNGYMYLIRGAKNGQETGFYSREYSNKRTIESLGLDPQQVAYAQVINGNTPFISTTTDLYTAAAFSQKQRIYVIKIPVGDVYTFEQDEMLLEEEYMIPDYISSSEIIRSFRYDKFKQIYEYLTKEIGLNITPQDLGITVNDLNAPNMAKIDSYIKFNNGSSGLDPFLSLVQDLMVHERAETGKEAQGLKDKGLKAPVRRIAFFTDAHALYEPVEAILNDIKEKGITEIYSLGDNIGLGPNPKEVIDLLEEHNVCSIAGNYEELITLGEYPFLSYLSNEKIIDAHWTKSVLTESQIDKIKRFPHSVNLDVAGQKITLCHFANDVRCDFTQHNCYGYIDGINSNLPSYEQFLYTNSHKQLLEFAHALGVEPTLIRNTSFQEGLKIIRNYINTNRDQIQKRKELAGYLSYVEDPLFVKDGQILTVKDYSAIIQGHTHFYSAVSDGDTSYYSLRSVGMGYSEEEKNLAQYMILNEYIDRYDIEVVNVPFDRDKMKYSILNCQCPNAIIKKYTKI